MFELLNQIKWRDHWLTLIRFAGALVLLVLAGWYYMDRQAALTLQERSHLSLKSTTAENEEYQRILEESYDHYRGLVSRGYIGDPRRLQWLESLRGLGARYDITGIQFTLEGSQFTSQGVDHFWHPEVRMRSSDMTVNLQLAHEVDLYRLMTGLDTDAEGLFSVERCRFRWLETTSEEDALDRFRGDCLLRWYTLLNDSGLELELDQTAGL